MLQKITYTDFNNNRTMNNVEFYSKLISYEMILRHNKDVAQHIQSAYVYI